MSKCEPLPPEVVALVIGDFEVAGPPQELLRTHKHCVYSCLLILGGKGKPCVGMGGGALQQGGGIFLKKIAREPIIAHKILFPGGTVT